MSNSGAQEAGPLLSSTFSSEKLDEALNRATADWSLRRVVVDVTEREAVDKAFASISSVEGRLDALVNCAGNAKPVASAQMTESDFDALLEVHPSHRHDALLPSRLSAAHGKRRFDCQHLLGGGSGQHAETRKL